MTSISRLSLVFFSFILLFACAGETNNSDEKSFDYITEISFDMPVAEFNTKLLSGFRLIGDNEEALSLELVKNDVKHEILFLSYGDEFFHEAFVHLDFNKKQEQIDHVFNYLEKRFTTKYGKCYLSDVKVKEESHHSWHVDPMDTELNRHITLSRSGQVITVQFTQYGSFDGSDEVW